MNGKIIFRGNGHGNIPEFPSVGSSNFMKHQFPQDVFFTHCHVKLQEHSHTKELITKCRGDTPLSVAPIYRLDPPKMGIIHRNPAGSQKTWSGSAGMSRDRSDLRGA